METLITSGQKKSIKRLLVDDTVVPYVDDLRIKKGPAQTFFSRGGEVQRALRLYLDELVVRFSSDPIAEEIKFYRDFFDLTVDLSGIKIPEYQAGLDWIDIIAKELLAVSDNRPHSFIIKAMREKGLPVWTIYDNFDAVLAPGISMRENDQRRNDRWPDKVSYATRSRNYKEADEENKNLSADDLEKMGISGPTCLEYLYRASKYFYLTGEYLDVKNWTLCSGSRYSDGRVPYAGFSVGKVSVDRRHPSGSGGRLRARLTAV